MHTNADNLQSNQSRTIANNIGGQSSEGELQEEETPAVEQNKETGNAHIKQLNAMQAMANKSPQVEQLKSVQSMADKASEKSNVSQRQAVPVVQRVYEGVKKLRLGITAATNVIATAATDLPAHTFVWILSNKTVAETALDGRGAGKVTKGHDKSSIGEIIAANTAKVSVGTQRQNKPADELLGGFFQSGAFEIPRKNAPANRNEVDYSFLRFAAIKSYNTWQAAGGNAAGWPAISSPKTLVETIDSDTSGITGETSEGRIEGETEAEQKVKADWLAEAGVYKWDWTEVKTNATVTALFTPEGGELNTVKRDAALQEFADKYFEAEKSARSAAKAGDIFKIYFPEPATRLSGAAITLLSAAGLSNMKVTRGSQLGHKRESIGLIAGLVSLDTGQDNDKTSRSKAKLRFEPSYAVTTGLGARKGDFVSVFAEWYAKAKKEGAEDFNAVDFSTLEKAKEFDQSYLNPDLAGQVQAWHTTTLTDMNKTAPKQAQGFFHPKGS